MDNYKYSAVKDKVALCDNVKIYGELDNRIKAVTDGLFLKLDMTALTDYFRNKLDVFAAGEFYGKIMRAACLICKYSGDERLRKVVDSAAADMMSIQDCDGDISTAPKQKQPNGSCGSDLWERKYVLLGLWEYYSAFGGQNVIDCMVKLALYTASQVGDPPKTPVTETGWAFCGIESSSILEPVMKLYNLTGEKELFALAEHIVNSGFCKRQNVIDAVLSGVYPKDIGNNGVPEQSIAKAYEMMSCFEGLLEYYRATGIEKYINCAGKFIEMINRREITYLGSGGADGPYNLGPGTGEQWNDTYFHQADEAIKLSMETCVTVTYMKLMLNYYRLTGDAALMDKIEISAYNALFGAMKQDGSFFDYFPKFNGTRSTKVNFSYDINGIPLSCCTANGPMGLAVLPYAAYCEEEKRCCINLYFPSEAHINGFGKIKTETDYPLDNKITVTVMPETESEYTLAMRIPGFCKKHALSHNAVYDNGYAVIKKTWKNKENITLTFDIPLICHPDPANGGKVLLTYGALVLARDKSVDPGSDRPVSFKPGYITEYKILRDPFRITAGGCIFIPYYKAGASWDGRTEYKCWLGPEN
ncbi:MAG: glycoside hydrolase family 127 protein [Clostridia bacterium]|nr:glycoside hydrolase family 127 protein [Clostridia bacterium]